jgi:hypothetical protein
MSVVIEFIRILLLIDGDSTFRARVAALASSDIGGQQPDDVTLQNERSAWSAIP